LEKVSARNVGERFVGLEEAMCAEATSVDDPLGNPLVVEVEDLLAKVEVLESRWASRPDLQRGLIVRNGNAKVRRKDGRIAVRRLV
jgi:hypothetical protein